MKCIFSLGAINKKLFFPLLLTLTQIIINVSDYLFKKYNIKSHQIMDSSGIGLGGMSSLFIPCILRYKKSDNEKICSKKNVKYMSIFIGIYLVYYAIFTISFLTTESSNLDDPHINSLFTREAFEIILLTIITYIFLKYKYYIHNIISLVIFCILSVVIDLVLKNYIEGIEKLGIKKIIFDVLIIICELICFCYQTYLMNNLFYNYWTLAFIIGAIIFILNLGTLSAALIKGRYDGEDNFFNNFYKYIKDEKAGFIILRFFLSFIFKGLFLQLFRVLILDYLTPNHILITYEITKIISVLTNPYLENKWYSLIPIAFHFLSLIFYLEILEYNFCGLNKNTKKNIELREKDDMIQRDSLLDNPNNEIDIGHGYLINKDNNKIEKEMNEISLEPINDDNIEEENTI